MDFIIVDVAAQNGIDLRAATRSDMRRIARQNSAKLPPAFHGLAALLNWVENGGAWPKISSDHPAYFYTLRATNTAEKDLVNMLLAQLAPLDVRQLFICHKQLFYRLYSGWDEIKKSYVVDFLEREYQVDKAGARAALFGHDAGIEEASPAVDDLIERVGPWGAIRGR